MMWYINCVFNHLTNRNTYVSLSPILQLRHKFSSFQAMGMFVSLQMKTRRDAEKVQQKGQSSTSQHQNNSDSLYQDLFSEESQEKRNKVCKKKIYEAYSFCVGTIAENLISSLVNLLDVTPTINKIQSNFNDFTKMLSNFTQQFISF